MENASKALLIAASVLIAILLIGVGIRIFNSTSGTTDSVEIVGDAVDIAMYNEQFTPYLGVQSASKVQELANLLNILYAQYPENLYTDDGIEDFTTIRHKSTLKCTYLVRHGEGPEYNVYIDTTKGYDEKGYIKKIIACSEKDCNSTH